MRSMFVVLVLLAVQSASAATIKCDPAGYATGKVISVVSDMSKPGVCTVKMQVNYNKSHGQNPECPLELQALSSIGFDAANTEASPCLYRPGMEVSGTFTQFPSGKIIIQ